VFDEYLLNFYFFNFFFIDIELMQERKVVDPKLTNTSDSKYSVQALSLLAEVCMCIIDFLLELLLDSLVKGYATFILCILIFHILSLL
jgi:hypothetical protein